MPPLYEIVDYDLPRGPFHSALFDFDGTLSLIRAGWQEVMVPYFVEELLQTPDCESQEAIENLIREFVSRLTGKQTIYQCFQLAEEVGKRGGTAREPLEYKREYLARLDVQIRDRVEGLRSGKIGPEGLLVPGSYAFLDALKARNVTLYLASGTDLSYVQEECDLLRLTDYFAPHIYGALDDYKAFSKQQIIEQILGENDLKGPELLVVGDGYVEIENGKGVGGYGLGIASDEAYPGRIDEWKRERLLGVGADLIAPDFSMTPALMQWLFPPAP